MAKRVSTASAPEIVTFTVRVKKDTVHGWWEATIAANGQQWQGAARGPLGALDAATAAVRDEQRTRRRGRHPERYRIARAIR
jgi:hypothetical protein